jgi:hypothetical protein
MKKSKMIKMLKASSSIIDASEAIGKKVKKFSGKPFKSMFKTNTVKAVVPHPVTGEESFTFEEDESVVSVKTCFISQQK